MLIIMNRNVGNGIEWLLKHYIPTFYTIPNILFIPIKNGESPPANRWASDFDAVWTGLEPATPCVTGTYSNQLNYQTSFSLLDDTKPDRTSMPSCESDAKIGSCIWVDQTFFVFFKSFWEKYFQRGNRQTGIWIPKSDSEILRGFVISPDFKSRRD